VTKFAYFYAKSVTFIGLVLKKLNDFSYETLARPLHYYMVGGQNEKNL
jgi:hypothetical protein